MTLDAAQIRAIRERARTWKPTDPATVAELCDNLTAAHAVIAALLDEDEPGEPSCATEPEACEHGIEHVYPDPMSHTTTVCYTHNACRGDTP